MRPAIDAITSAFTRFVESERTGGVLLVAATLLSLTLANSAAVDQYLLVWDTHVGSHSIREWINDGLMAVFFLLIGLELQREFHSGELSDRQRALLPGVAALGGMLVPAGIHLALNVGAPTQAGAGIPMATDIAFAMGALALLRARVPAALKVFVVAFAVIDDIGAIFVIAAFYSTDLALWYLLSAVALWIALRVLGQRFRVRSVWPYAIGGVALWWIVLQSGVHATLAGVALAFAVPHSSRDEDADSPAHAMENALHRPVALLILPLFALANTALPISGGVREVLVDANNAGIILGLLVGKPLGLMLFAYAAVAAGLCRLPAGVNWSHMIGAGFLGGIGFTMSIFVANLAFPADASLVQSSTLAVLIASALAGAVGYVWLRAISATNPPAQ